ncbi:hypothetical protein BBJ28_00025308 [Nothophytophthora sp. Chile5]|nr:hypothetical protein BBJ28_00025308 [Nothophytophthora sp. Chile5]
MGNVSTRALAPLVQHHRRHARLFLALVLLYVAKKVFGPALLSALVRWHYARTAERPRLLYRATAANEKLLSRCVTMSTFIVCTFWHVSLSRVRYACVNFCVFANVCMFAAQKKYYPPWYLFNGHLQTVGFAKETRAPQIAYKRQLLDMPDGGVVSLDWALLSDQTTEVNGALPTSSSWLPDVDPARRTVLLLPGLTGGSPEVYIRRTIAGLHELGWQCVVLNARGCAQTPVKTAQLFCTAYTEDLRFVLKTLAEKYDFAHEAFIGVGFSMGSNVLVKYLGEEGENAPLTGAISVGNPFDLVKVAANLSASLFNRLTYDKMLNSNMRALFFKNVSEWKVVLQASDLSLTLRRCLLYDIPTNFQSNAYEIVSMVFVGSPPGGAMVIQAAKMVVCV